MLETATYVSNVNNSYISVNMSHLMLAVLIIATSY